MDTLIERSARAKHALRLSAALLALSGCGNQPGATSDGPPPKGIGLAHIQLNVDPDALTSDVEYEITGNGILRVKGVMEAIAGTSAIGVVVNLPTGVGYLIRIQTSVANDGRPEEVCRASAMFDVSISKATELPLTLQCDADGSRSDGGTSDGGTSDGGTSDGGVDAGRTVVIAVPSDSIDAAVDAQVVEQPPVRPVGTPTTDAAAESCEACSKRLCFEVRSIQRDRDCYMTNGQILNGPAQGAYRADVCASFLKCAHRTGCGTDNPEECYCGPGISTESCIKHGPVGVCRGEYEAAGESWEPADLLGDKLTMRYTVLNAALPLLSCEAARCEASCFPAAKN
ncbi:MAG: hypothetical protein RLZZ450_795 [Pseudomonadota bacterium]|jgi:hypothetical protein